MENVQHTKSKDELIGCPLQAQVTQSSSTGTTKSAPFESKQLGEYTTRTEIGRGKFGVVFKAQHGIDERLYAIKQVDPVDTEQSPKKVLREARFLAELDHPNIVRYYGAWLEKPPPGEKLPRMDSNELCLYIKMEWCSDSTLHEWLEQNRLPAQRPTKQTLDWFRQLVSAVKYIHDKGLIHRDIKPQNIFFGSSSNGVTSVLKIGDFGLAIDVAPSSSSRANGGVSQSLSIVGTPSYMSPEQSSGRYKNSTDIYSLGLVFLELVHPFKTDRERYAVFGDLRANQRPDVMKKLGEKMDELISRTTAFEPEKRATSSELENELKKMMEEDLREKPPSLAVTSQPVSDNRQRCSMSDRSVLAQTVFHEARGEPLEGQKAAAFVVMNRARANRGYWGGSTIQGVCLHPYQFGCWNGNRRPVADSEMDRYPDVGVYHQILSWADDVIARRIGDPSEGALYYSNPSRVNPGWVKNVRVIKSIGNHVFYGDK